MKTITLGADHAGFALKEHLKIYLEKKGFTVLDVGAKKLVKTDDLNTTQNPHRLVSNRKCPVKMHDES